MIQKSKKRATSAIPIIAYEKEDIEPLVNELIEIIEATNWDYKSEFRDLFRMRDKALVSLLFLETETSFQDLSDEVAVLKGNIFRQLRLYIISIIGRKQGLM